MYDLRKKQEYLKKFLRKLRNQVRKDEINGMCVIVFKKDKTVERFQFNGDTTLVEWVGAMEAVKTYFLINLLDDYDDDW